MANIIVAKTGGTINDAEKRLAFTSDRDCMIELISGHKTVSSVDNYQHSLGYVPSYTVFFKVITSEITGVPNNCYSPCIGIIGNVLDGGTATVDTDKLYFQTYQVYNPVTDTYDNVTTDFYYSIFANTIGNQTGTGKNNVSGKARIAKNNLSVPDITDARQFKFFVGNVFKQDTALSGTITLMTLDYDLKVITIPHNLGYVPIVYMFESDNGSRIPYSLPGGLLFTYYVDSSNIYVVGGDFYNLGGDIYTLKYIILRDKIA